MTYIESKYLYTYKGKLMQLLTDINVNNKELDNQVEQEEYLLDEEDLKNLTISEYEVYEQEIQELEDELKHLEDDFEDDLKANLEENVEENLEELEDAEDVEYSITPEVPEVGDTLRLEIKWYTPLPSWKDESLNYTCMVINDYLQRHNLKVSSYVAVHGSRTSTFNAVLTDTQGVSVITDNVYALLRVNVENEEKEFKVLGVYNPMKGMRGSFYFTPGKGGKVIKNNTVMFINDDSKSLQNFITNNYRKLK